MKNPESDITDSTSYSLKSGLKVHIYENKYKNMTKQYKDSTELKSTHKNMTINTKMTCKLTSHVVQEHFHYKVWSSTRTVHSLHLGTKHGVTCTR